MAHLLNIWPSVAARLRRAGRVLLLFDYDGTLTPIVARPEDALLPGDVRQRLTALAAHPRYITGIVSGRSLDDLAALAGIPGLIHAGNHGMEIRGLPAPSGRATGPGPEFTHPGAIAARHTLDHARAALSGALTHIPGIIVEHKGLTLTVHYRATPETLAAGVDPIVTDTTAPYVDSGELRLTRGKMVIEVRPAISWDKGKAIELIRSRCHSESNYCHSERDHDHCHSERDHRHSERSEESPPLPVYFGDDRTDEDGFRVVQDMGGLAVFVGEPRAGTVALHQLDSPREVAEVLRLLLEET